MTEKEGIHHTFRERKFLKSFSLAKNIKWKTEVQIEVDWGRDRVN